MVAGIVAGALHLCLLAAPGSGMYLPPSETGGAEYQLNPASAELRQAVKRSAPRPADLLDARVLADDLVFLRRALRKLYVGYPELLQVPGFDVEALFDQHISRLRSGPPRVSFESSALALFRELKSHINDRHLELAGAPPDPREDYREYQLAWPAAAAGPDLARCRPTDARASISPSTLRLSRSIGAKGPPRPLLTVSGHSPGDTLELDCAGARHLLTARPRATAEEGQADKPVYEWRPAGQAAIIRIRYFRGPPPELARLEQLAADYPKHRRFPVIVFDLRGNGGGADFYAYRWVEQAKRGRWDPQAWAVFPPGAHLPWHRWNNSVWDAIAQGRVDDPAAVAEREQLRSQWPRHPSELFVRFVPHLIENHAKAPYRGRVFVLVDRRCGSAGEGAALMLQRALGGLLVGERTAGYKEYGNQRRLVLPGTQLVFMIATKRNYFTTPVESVGMPVDYYLPPERQSAPVEELLPLLRALPTSPPPSSPAP